MGDAIIFDKIFSSIKQRVRISNNTNLRQKEFEFKLAELCKLLLQNNETINRRPKRDSVVSLSRRRRVSMQDIFNNNKNDQNNLEFENEDTFDRVMAGGQRLNGSESEIDSSESDGSDYNEEESESATDSQMLSATDESESEYSQSSQSRNTASRMQSMGQIYDESDYSNGSSGVLQTDSSPSEYDSVDSYDGNSTTQSDSSSHGHHNRNESISKVNAMGSSMASGVGYIGNKHRPLHPDDDGMDSEEDLYSSNDSDSEYTQDSHSQSDDDENMKRRKRQQASFSVVRNHQNYQNDDDESTNEYSTSEEDDDDDANGGGSGWI